MTPTCVNLPQGSVDALRGGNCTNSLFPSEMGSTLKGKNVLPEGANSFLLE